MIEQLRDIIFEFMYHHRPRDDDDFTIVVGTELYRTIMMGVNCRVYFDYDYKNPTLFDLPFKCDPTLGKDEYEIRNTLRKGELK